MVVQVAHPHLSVFQERVTRLAQELAVLSLRNKLQKIMEGQEIPYHIQTKSPTDLCVICAFPGPQRQEEDYCWELAPAWVDALPLDGVASEEEVCAWKQQLQLP